MKFPIWKSASSVAAPPEDFAGKLGALRMATGRADRVVSHCVCAVHDKPFTVVYERTDPAKRFAITGIYRDEEASTATGKGVARSRILPIEEVDSTGWRCPYCNNTMRIGCEGCSTNVCGGKTRRYPGTEDIFECRVSCGARSTLVPATTFSGVDPAQPGKPARAQPQHTALPSPDRAALPGPASPRLRGK